MTTGGAASVRWIPDPQKAVRACRIAGLDTVSMPFASALYAAGEYETSRRMVWEIIENGPQRDRLDAVAFRGMRYLFDNSHARNRRLYGLSYLTAAASHGHAASNYALSWVYESGLCIRKDQRWPGQDFLANAGTSFNETNDAHGHSLAGLKWASPGECIHPNPKAAAALLRVAVKADYLPAHYLAARWIRDGYVKPAALGISSTAATYEKKVFRKVKNASETGNLRARFLLALAHEDGVGTTKDLRLAGSIYKDLSDLGLGYATDRYACLHDSTRTDCGTLDNSPEIATKYYIKGVGLGDRNSMNALGWSHCLGDGAQREIEKCVSLLEDAATLGHMNAANNLALLYDGRGRLGEANQELRNPDLALEWYRRAAALGNRCAVVSVAHRSSDNGEVDQYEALSIAQDKDGRFGGC
ncbi:tetratricopeptide repeat protein [Pelagimonas phthalicica]|nr:tetratricopeptide repeat protein [Pelagimonas phthalicica]